MLSESAPRVNRSQWLRITSQRPTKSAATTSTIGIRSRTWASLSADQVRRQIGPGRPELAAAVRYGTRCNSSHRDLPDRLEADFEPEAGTGLFSMLTIRL